MPALRFLPIDSALARHLRQGGVDALGCKPDHAVSDGDGVPCRHCLGDIPAGKPYLIVAHRPFSGPDQPYAEIGPIFLCAEDCAAHDPDSGLPESFRARPEFLLRGYGADERIVYGTGALVPTARLEAHLQALFARKPEIAFVHLRSAGYSCFRARVERAAAPRGA